MMLCSWQYLLLAVLGVSQFTQPVLGQYIHRGWTPGLEIPDNVRRLPHKYAKNTGWSPGGKVRHVYTDGHISEIDIKNPSVEPKIIQEAGEDTRPVVPQPPPSPPRAPRNESVTEKAVRVSFAGHILWTIQPTN